ncbi:AfsR/SARP family transcriptional regulator [Actinomycetes bacterium KLBMP 9797]
MWHGPALADTAGTWLSDMVGAALNEERIVALEERAATDIRLGRDAGLVADLSAVVGEQPLRERSVCLLMTALDRGGRRAEALALFRETRQRLIDDLGIEPSPELQRAHVRILESCSPRTTPTSTWERPTWRSRAGTRPTPSSPTSAHPSATKPPHCSHDQGVPHVVLATWGTP